MRNPNYVQLSSTNGENITLHYEDEGRGDPVVFVHGSLADLSYWRWSGMMERLAVSHRVIAYSRRYNYPNDNTPGGDHSAAVEAHDLAGFLNAVGLEQVHLVGHSYGAFTALVYALAQPKRVRSLILAEPPIVPWLSMLPGGARFDGFMDKVWRPLGDAFREGDEAGLEFTSRWYFRVPFMDAPVEWRPLLERNIGEWRALALSSDAFPMVSFDDIRRLNVPALLLSGARNAEGFNHLIDNQLEALLPEVRRVVVPNAGHEMFLDNPEVCAHAMLEHLSAL